MRKHPTAGNRSTRELQESIVALCRKESEKRNMPPSWRFAAAYVEGWVSQTLKGPHPPKRSYYGAKGSTRNPFRS